MSKVVALATFSLISMCFTAHAQDRNLLIEKFVSTLGSMSPSLPLVETSVPSVGCPRDGQVGAEPAPRLSNKTILLPQNYASKVAFYSTSDNGDYGVLGPRGWSCFGTYGSSGSRLYVVPNEISGPILDRPEKIGGGPAIVLIGLNGGTSGRFAMAKMAARVFPRARAFAEKVRAEQFDDPAEYVFVPWPQDTVVHLSDFAASYVTPASTMGLGTMSGPMPGPDPIKGLVFLNLDATGGDPYVVKLAVRLPQAATDMYPAIAVAHLGEHFGRGRTELAHCYISVEGVTYMDRPCTVRREGGVVSVGEGTNEKYNVHLSDEDKKIGNWNGRDGGSRTNVSLGSLQRQGDCWVNTDAGTRVCVFTLPTTVKTQSSLEKDQVSEKGIREFPLASCKGPNATLVRLTAANSANARIDGVMQEANIKEYCERMIVGDAEKLRTCVLRMERALGLKFSATANCGRHLVTSIRNLKRDTLELRVKGVSKVRVLSRDQETVDWEMRSLVSGETFGFVCAYGTPPLAEQFQLMCPEEWARMVDKQRNFVGNDSLKSNTDLQSRSYIGKWYDDDQSVCKTKLGEPNKNGSWAIGYTEKETFGHESRCRIVRAIPRGTAVELSLLCSVEGMTSREKELVEVVGGRLRRTVSENGKLSTSTYTRCP